MTKNLKVGVIFGGKSGEHEVSIQSAKSMMASLDASKYTVVPIGISKSGGWYTGLSAVAALAPADETLYRLVSAANSASSADTSSVDATATSEIPALPTPVQASPSEIRSEIDVVIPVMHGTHGEDGSIQGLLEILDIPYVGAGVTASAVGLDKVFMKTVFQAAGLPQVAFTWYTKKTWQQNPQFVKDDIEEKLGFPCFVKPASLGSSVGISKVKNRSQLDAAFQVALKYDRKVIVEQGVDIREIEVAVLGNDQPKASVPGEVVPSNEFYDYKAKYLDGESALIIPADVPAGTADEIRNLAVKAFLALDCSGLARVDFFIEKSTGRVLLNEINTMPGFTQYSMYPKLWEATGVSYEELVTTLVQLALERHAEKAEIQTDFHVEEE